MQFFVVGAGRLGVGLASVLKARGHELVGAWNRGSARDRDIERALGIVPSHGDFPAELNRAELVFVTTRDDAIAGMGAQLAQSGHLSQSAIVAHTSGCFPASLLGDLGGRKRASLHPVASLPDVELAEERLVNATYVLEGDDKALAALTPIVTTLESRAVVLAGPQKARYHAALALAANLSLVLLDAAEREAQAAGFSEVNAIRQLVMQAVASGLVMSPGLALTGPLVRGDVGTIAEHLRALGPNTNELYRDLALAALPLLEQRGVSAEVRAALRDELTR